MSRVDRSPAKRRQRRRKQRIRAFHGRLILAHSISEQRRIAAVLSSFKATLERMIGINENDDDDMKTGLYADYAKRNERRNRSRHEVKNQSKKTNIVRNLDKTSADYGKVVAYKKYAKSVENRQSRLRAMVVRKNHGVFVVLLGIGLKRGELLRLSQYGFRYEYSINKWASRYENINRDKFNLDFPQLKSLLP